MKKLLLFTILLTTSLMISVVPAELMGQVPSPENSKQDMFKDVANELRCPTCTGLSVLDSDAPFSVQIKDLVQEKVNEGATKSEILDFFTERYGPWILRSPPKEGLNLIAWLVPVLLLCLGPLFLWLFVWRKRKTTATFGVRSAELIVEEFTKAVAAKRSH